MPLLCNLRIELTAVLGTNTLCGQDVWVVFHRLEEYGEDLVRGAAALNRVESAVDSNDSEQFESHKLVP